jgi:hypothetical protein
MRFRLRRSSVPPPEPGGPPELSPQEYVGDRESGLRAPGPSALRSCSTPRRSPAQSCSSGSTQVQSSLGKVEQRLHQVQATVEVLLPRRLP